MFVGVLCIAVGVWSLAPAVSHTPAIADAAELQAEMLAEHGHDHGFVADVLWAMHGHAHDATDHDHNPATLARGTDTMVRLGVSNRRAIVPTRLTSDRLFRLERPPSV